MDQLPTYFEILSGKQHILQYAVQNPFFPNNSGLRANESFKIRMKKNYMLNKTSYSKI